MKKHSEKAPFMKIINSIVVLLAVAVNTNAQLTELSADNGIIKLKVDLTRGGAINYLSRSSDNRNLVNIHDEGRYIQQSYYAGNDMDRRGEGQSSHWSPWPWNPIQVGDAFGNRAEILDYQKNGDSIYVKCIPMLWDMNNKPAEATIEQWTILKSNVLEIHNRLTCFRTDLIYGENVLRDQELPAIYPISALENLYCYLGNAPFTNDTISNPSVVNLSSGFWGRYNNVNEHWMAFVDTDLFGIGVYNPQSSYFLAGMAGVPGKESLDGATSYIAPIKKEALGKNSVYDYTYYIIVGTLTEIRNKVYELRAITDVENHQNVPAECFLPQNYPNPFNKSTTVKYGLSEQSFVKIEIFNMLGQNVGVLVNSEKQAGYYQTNWDAFNLKSGIYLISITIKDKSFKRNFTKVKKALLLK